MEAASAEVDLKDITVAEKLLLPLMLSQHRGYSETTPPLSQGSQGILPPRKLVLAIAACACASAISAVQPNSMLPAQRHPALRFHSRSGHQESTGKKGAHVASVAARLTSRALASTRVVVHQGLRGLTYHALPRSSGSCKFASNDAAVLRWAMGEGLRISQSWRALGRSAGLPLWFHRSCYHTQRALKQSLLLGRRRLRRRQAVDHLVTTSSRCDSLLYP